MHGVLSSGITSPVGSRLCVHGAAGGVLRIAVRHITLLRVWAVLAVVLGVGRAGRSNGWIYRNILVRLDLSVVMVATILQRQ